jgi:hypothetical protein
LVGFGAQNNGQHDNVETPVGMAPQSSRPTVSSVQVIHPAASRVTRADVAIRGPDNFGHGRTVWKGVPGQISFVHLRLVFLQPSDDSPCRGHFVPDFPACF